MGVAPAISAFATFSAAVAVRNAIRTAAAGYRFTRRVADRTARPAA